MKNKLDSLFFAHAICAAGITKQPLSWSKFEILPTIPPAKSIACGMEMSNEENVICGNCVVDCRCGDISVR